MPYFHPPDWANENRTFRSSQCKASAALLGLAPNRSIHSIHSSIQSSPSQFTQRHSVSLNNRLAFL